MAGDRTILRSDQTRRYVNTTAYWEARATLIPKKGDIYIYEDGGSYVENEQTVIVPKVKIGDGATSIKDLPFVGDDILPDKHFTFEWRVLQTSLSINHNLHKKPSVTVVDTAGSELFCEVFYTDDDNITLTFSSAVRGTAYLN